MAISDKNELPAKAPQEEKVDEENKVKHRKPHADTVEKYDGALSLYASTMRSAKSICQECGVSVGGFLRYVHKYHRQLLLSRHGIEVSSPEEAKNVKLYKRWIPNAQTIAKYKEAIEACDDPAYLKYNVSQIARLFKVKAKGLSAKLYTHYPEIIERREQERHRLGLNDNVHRGIRPWCKEQYAKAIELLQTTDMTINEAAEACNVSMSGLSRHVLYYHRELLDKRNEKRQISKKTKKKGQITGNGRLHLPTDATQERYQEAVRLYLETYMPVKKIAEITGVNKDSLNYHLRTWHLERAFDRRGIKYEAGKALSELPQYKASVAVKYAPAIARLKKSKLPVSKVAAEFGLNPETFRQYLKEHKPQLFADSGMMVTPEGKYILRRSADKFADALQAYRTTTASRNEISKRFGLNDNTFGGFLHRHYPEAIREHNELVERSKKKDET